MMAHQSKKRSKRRGPPPRLPQRQSSDNSLRARRSHQEFQLISPLSDLSNPSCIKNLPTPFDPNNKEARTFVLENVPHPDRISKNRTHVLPNNAAAVVNKSNKNKKPAVAAASKKKIKNKLAHCLTGGAHRLDLMRVQTTKAVKQTYSKTVKQGVAKAKAIPSKKESLDQSGDDEGTLGMAARLPGESLGWTGSGTKGNNTTGILNGTKDSYFETLWRDQRADGSYIQNNHSIIQEGTPTIALNKVFEDALGLHRADEYFDRLADAPSASPRLDQVESLASVMQEDTTCVSYLISEASNTSPALSKTGTVEGGVSVSKKHIAVGTSGAVVKTNGLSPGNNHTSISSSPNLQEETNDSIFRVSSEARAKLLAQQKRNSLASSKLVYSPETAQGESITSASLYTTDSPASEKENNEQAPSDMVSSSEAPSAKSEANTQVESRDSVSSDDASPIPLMGELVSLNSNKYDKSESPLSESSKSASSDAESTKLRRDHVRIASLASFASLPVEQDTSTIPFEEAGVSAIAEESLSKVEFCRQGSDSEDSIQEKEDGSRLIACSDSDSATNEIVETDSDIDAGPVEEASLEDCVGNGSNIIVSISTLAESSTNVSVSTKSTLSHDGEIEGDAYSASGEESAVVTNASVDSGSTFVQQDDDNGTVYSASDDESEEIIVAISKLPDESVASASIDMPMTRLHFSDMSVDAPSSSRSPPPLTVESEECEEGQGEEKVEQGHTSDEAEADNAGDSVDEESFVVKTAVATGRVFAPRAPGELLISVDLETLVDDVSAESFVSEEQSEANESMEESKRRSTEETIELQPKAINLVTNPKALLLQEQVKVAKSIGRETPVVVETVSEESVVGYESDVSAKERANGDNPEGVESVVDDRAHGTKAVNRKSKSSKSKIRSKKLELVTTKVTDNANGYAGDIMTLCTSPTAVETTDSKVEEASPAPKTSTQQSMVLMSNKNSQMEEINKPDARPPLDHRMVATTTEKPKTTKSSRLVVNYLAADSPSGDSVATSTGGSPIPLLSEQALSNAAFLFSPSYADGKQRVLMQQAAKPPREMSLSSFSISTAESRSRLSTFSARSRPAFSIPVSTAPLNMSSIRPSQSSRSYEGYSFVEAESKQSQEEDLQTVSLGDSHASREGGRDKHVHFSTAGDECHVIRDANTSRVAMGTPVTVVSPPPIDRKISDLTEGTLPYAASTNESVPSPQREASVDGLSHRQRVAKILRDIEEDDETVEDADFVVEQFGDGVSDSSPETAVNWTYREENGVLGAATPLRSNASQGTHLAPTNSPRLRFKEAKNMFNKPSTLAEQASTQTLPVPKKTRPVSSGGSVSSRVSALNDRLRSNRQPTLKGPRRETGGENALAPRHATLDAPLFRNPVIMTYKDDASHAPSEAVETVVSGGTKSDTGVSTVVSDTGVSTLASVDLKSDTGVSTIASTVEEAGTGTVVSADLSVDEDEERKEVLTTMMGSPEESDSEDDEDDAFADARRLSDEFEHPIYGQKLRQSGPSLQSLLERDEQAKLSRRLQGRSLSSIVSEDPSTLTFETEKENSVAPAPPRVGSLGSKVLSFKNNAATVNPRAQQPRHVVPQVGDLCLSPTKRTPLQARKWRSLAAAAQEKDQAKKQGGSKSKRGLLLKERNSNIMMGGKQ